MSARKTIAAALSVVCAMAAVMVLTSSQAFAAEPVVTTETPSEGTETSVVLHGTIRPEGHEITECRFEYEQDNGLPPVYDEQVSCQQSPGEINASSNGTEPVAVSAVLSGLTPHSKYHVRLGSSTTTGSTTGAGIEFLTTVPVVGTGAATEAKETSAVLHGTITPEDQEITGCQFEYEFERSFGYPSFYEEHIACKQSPAEINALSKGGTEPVSVSAELGGLRPRNNYHVRLHAATATNSNMGAEVEFYTLAVPAVAEQVAVDVTSTGATIHASIEAGGLSAAYRVEYGPTGSHGSTAEVNIGAPKFPVTVEVPLSSLEPGIEYHFRVVATNALGTGAGADSTFTTAGNVGPTSSILPDGRISELVSPGEGSQNVYDPFVGAQAAIAFRDESVLTFLAPMRAAASGNAIAYAGEPSPEGGNGAFGNGQANQLMSNRTPDGWATEDITPENTNSLTKYDAFSEDLTLGILGSIRPVTSASPAGPAGCKASLYARDAASGDYRSLVTETVEPGVCGRPLFAGGSENGSHLLFTTAAGLTSGAHPGNENKFESEHEEDLYDSVNGMVHQVNISPDGQPETFPIATFGGSGEFLPDLSNDISTDGSRVFWTSNVHSEENYEQFVPKALYVRENDEMPQSPLGSGGECSDPADACTIQLDLGERACVLAGKCESGGGRFWGASADGTHVFFTDCARLTADSTAVPGKQCMKKRSAQTVPVPNGNDLYEYDLETAKLTDLTIDHSGDPIGADVQGVVGISEDGDYVYFVANGSLTEGADTQLCESAGGCNLYVLHDGETSYIGALQYGDNNFESLESGADPRGDWRGSMGERTAEVTPDGKELVFISSSSLTGYDSAGYREVFVYDASDKNLVCASCDPSRGAA